jgi:riboflavin synthase
VFTGLVDDVGIVSEAKLTPAGLELRVSCRYAALAPGESIAVNGACLTVRECGDGWFTAAAVATTLARTTIGDWRSGQKVNLERSLRAGDRMGGHIVQGHVDAVAKVDRITRLGDATLVDITVPEELDGLLVLHGSVTVDGVSLTVNALPSECVLQVSLVEYTVTHTTLGTLQAGDRVHIEADILGKYVQRLLAPHVNRV